MFPEHKLHPLDAWQAGENVPLKSAAELRSKKPGGYFQRDRVVALVQEGGLSHHKPGLKRGWTEASAKLGSERAERVFRAARLASIN